MSSLRRMNSDEGLLSEEDFRDFVFGNSVWLRASTNPDFFKGTIIEKQATDYLYPALHRGGGTLR